MVTFRFYIVSTVAFFLALAVGVVVGSVLDEGIVSSLEDRLERVEENLDDTVASIDEKNREIEDLEVFADQVAPFAVENRLEQSSTLVVAESGVAEEPVRDLVRRLREGGSQVEGIVWLDPRWNLADREDREAVAELIEQAPAARPALRRAVWAELFGSTAPATPGDPAVPETTATTAEPGTTPTGPDPETDPGAASPDAPEVAVSATESGFSSPLLSALADLGVLRLERIDPRTDVAGERVLVSVTGADSNLSVPGETSVELVESAAALEVPSVLAEVLADGADSSGRGQVISSVLDASTARFSTVDDLDLIAGRVATVLALADARLGVLGRYGYGPDTDGVLPRWQAP